MEAIVVFRTFDLAEAQVVHSRLVQAGLDAEVLHAASAAALDVAIGGVRVVVPENQVEDARNLINSEPGVNETAP